MGGGGVLSGVQQQVDLEAVLEGGGLMNGKHEWNASYDLIVVGSHGRRGFRRFLLGSVSEAVAMNAHCSVVVVRAQRKAET